MKTMTRVSAIRNDFFTIIKDSATEEAPISSNRMVKETGIDQARVTSTLTSMMKQDKFLHRRKIVEFSDQANGEIELYAYWYDATKPSEFFKLRARGEAPTRGSAGRAVANAQKETRAAPASSIRNGIETTALPAIMVGKLVFIEFQGKRFFSDISNFKEA